MLAMQVARTIEELRKAVAEARRGGARIALVPTMGALHAGHLSLIARARASAPFVAVSIFVNPTQFGPNEDLARYPRDEAADLAACRAAGADLVFLPSEKEMYPGGEATTVHVRGLTDTLCAPLRPGHFDGVATVVTKLFNLVQPDVACFGEKDYQQLAVIRRMVRDLSQPIEIVGCATVREPDGLALSSRNRLLSPSERSQAGSLSRALRDAVRRVGEGERDVSAIEQAMRAVVQAAGPAQIEYAAVVDADTLTPLKRLERPALAALAVRLGATRLIDNMRLEPKG